MIKSTERSLSAFASLGQFTVALQHLMTIRASSVSLALAVVHVVR